MNINITIIDNDILTLWVGSIFKSKIIHVFALSTAFRFRYIRESELYFIVDN